MRRLPAIIGAAIALTACGVQSDTTPRDVPDDERALAVRGGPSGDEASGGDRIYLVGPGEDRLLRSVTRDASSPEDLIEILLRGPNDDELAAQYSTNILPSTQLLSARPQGQFLTIDLSSEITELAPQSLSQAIAQIVYTATEIDGVETVQIRVEDEPLAWPTATGEPKTDLRIYDYPNLVQTAQPAYPAVPASPEG